LGFRFAFVACLGMGLSLGMEYHRAREGRVRKTSPSERRNYRHVLLVAGLRSLSVALALAVTAGFQVGLVYFPSYLLYVLLYNALGLAPADIRLAQPFPRLRPKALLFSLVYGLGSFLSMSLAYWLSGSLPPRPVFSPALFGLAVAWAAFFASMLSPVVEYWSDRMPRKTLALLGVSFAVLGFLLQALPSWLVLLRQ
jgi:predicted MFS family arabinose efflux permease